VTELRIERAKQMLARTSLSVERAQAIGIQHQRALRPRFQARGGRNACRLQAQAELTERQRSPFRRKSDTRKSGSAARWAAVLSEDGLHVAVNLLVRLVEAGAALIIFSGSVVGFGRFFYNVARGKRADSFLTVRLDLARFLALGLEFQLSADLLRTAISPGFREIGQLAAVATIRTALNYFLGREIRAERGEVRDAPPAP
jgi:uncharacterized membrane protein